MKKRLALNMLLNEADVPCCLPTGCLFCCLPEPVVMWRKQFVNKRTGESQGLGSRPWRYLGKLLRCGSPLPGSCTHWGVLFANLHGGLWVLMVFLQRRRLLPFHVVAKVKLFNFLIHECKIHSPHRFQGESVSKMFRQPPAKMIIGC